MKRVIECIRYIDNDESLEVEVDAPNECPVCHHAQKPELLYGCTFDFENEGESYSKVSATYLCNACYTTFISTYKIDNSKECIKGELYGEYESSTPCLPPETNFPEVICKISPLFIEIYDNAAVAESYSLKHISGIGYRKALEFLIKDYLISETPAKKSIIEGIQLGKCINEYISDNNLKTVASRAVWLGNDQTHYIQKFKNKDVEDLKKLIQISVHWITMILLTREAENIKPQR